MATNFTIHPLGDNAVILQFSDQITAENHRIIQRFISYFEHNPIKWMIDYIPAFTTISIFYDPAAILTLSPTLLLPYDYVCSQLRRFINGLPQEKIAEQDVVEIPVCYGGEYGPDLEFVADYNRIATNEVIRLHSDGNYLVHMIGFSPGFPYLGGMPAALSAPRKQSPRQIIPAGSVGIAGNQTGIYPIETPGGWQLIGRTPIPLFRPDDDLKPTLLKAGDRIKFKPISFEEYFRIEEAQLL